MVLNVCAAKILAAGGASGESRRTLQVAQASDWQGLGAEGQMAPSSGSTKGETGIYRVLEILQPCVRLVERRFLRRTTEDLECREDGLNVGHGG